jgi:hypothetical protein
MDMNHEQVKNILSYIDSTQPEHVKQDIFCQLGRQCFKTRNLHDWVITYQDNIQAFLDRVNIENASPYWERLEFNEDGSILYLTGKKVQKCACAFGECEKPPVSLCQYCCKTFQENIFGTLYKRKVEVEITASYIFGDERCSTAIHLL